MTTVFSIPPLVSLHPCAISGDHGDCALSISYYAVVVRVPSIFDFPTHLLKIKPVLSIFA